MRDIRDAICDAGAVCMTPSALARRLGTSEGEAMDLLAELDVAGIVEAWDSLDGLVVTLTPLGAERLGMRLVEDGRHQRWQRAGDPEPPPPRARNVLAAEADARPAFGPDDPAPPAVRAEAQREDRRCDPAGYPYPTVLLGSGLIWDNVPRAVCPACHNKPLGPHVFCLRCDRWGLDSTLARKPRPAAAPPPCPRGEDAHKARRRERLAR